MADKGTNHIVIYGKPDCHLCELAYELVMGLGDAYELSVEKIDITSDPLLWKKYREEIPVLVINQHTTLTAPIRLNELRSRLNPKGS